MSREKEIVKAALDYANNLDDIKPTDEFSRNLCIALGQAFMKGAGWADEHQAEKDLELTVDDIMKIDALLIEMWNKPSNKDGYQEVLKRFKDLKKGKNYEIQDKVQRPYKQAKAVCQ